MPDTASPRPPDIQRGRYSANLLGAIRSHLEGLQGFEVMALELLQNADDAKAERIIFDVTKDALIVSNSGQFSRCGDLSTPLCEWARRRDELGRDACDFHGITEVASGGKLRHPDNIGRFGIGFVSVYQITDHPEIQSNNTSVVLIPEDETFEYSEYDVTEGTRFFLKWAKDPDSSTRHALGASSISSDDIESLPTAISTVLSYGLLFLKHVRHAEVRKNGALVSAFELSRYDDTDLLEIRSQHTGKTDQWLLLRVDAKSAVNELFDDYPRLSELRRKTEVSIAVPITSEDPLRGLFYAFLPTEQETGLPLHINGDFFPEPDRKSITLAGNKHQQAWNETLITCAAKHLAQHLIRLRDTLTPVAFWRILASALEVYGKSKNGHLPLPLSGFWDEFSRVMDSEPKVAWTSECQWSRCKDVYFSSKYETEQIRALEHFGVQLIHISLHTYQNVLLSAGTHRLNPNRLADALNQSPALSLLTKARVGTQDLKTFLIPLWEVVENLLEAAPQTRPGNDPLAECPCMLTVAGDLKSPKKCIAIPTAINRKQLYVSLPLPNFLAEVCEKFPRLSGKAPTLNLRHVVDFLMDEASSAEVVQILLKSDQQSLRRFYRLIRDIAFMGEQEATLEELTSLANLPIFPGGYNFVRASDAFLPGDFQDPIGVTNLLDPQYFDGPTLEFIRESLHVESQSLAAFVRQQLPQFFSAEPDASKYQKVLSELARHASALESENLLDFLSELKLIPTRDDGWDAPDAVYRYSEELESVLGENPAWWLDESRIPDSKVVDSFLDHLGVRRLPAATHLVGRLQQISEDPPTEDAQKLSEKVFYEICEHFSRWEHENGQDLEILKMLRELSCLPADGVTDEWFRPSELHAPFRPEGFWSQAKILPFRNMARLKRPALEFLDFVMEPETRTVVSHLRYCVANDLPAHYNVYQILSERSDHEDSRTVIATLTDEQCIFDQRNKDYLRPNQVFWSTPHLGGYAFKVPDTFQQFRAFLELVGVKEHPAPEDCLEIVAQIADRFGDSGVALPSDEYAVVRSCLLAISEALYSFDAETGERFARLGEIPAIPNLDDQLCWSDEVVIRDSEWHAVPFDDELDKLSIKPDPDLQSLYDFLRIPSLSDVVTPLIDFKEGERNESELQQRIRDRTPLLLRVLYDQPTKIKKTLRDALLNIRVIACKVLHVRFQFRSRDVDISSPAQPARALYERTQNVLYVAEPPDDSIWSEVLKSVFHLMLPPAHSYDLPNRILNAKMVMTTPSEEHAAQDLYDAGIPELAPNWDDIVEAPEGEELGELESGANEVEEAPTKDQEERTSDLRPESEEETGDHAQDAEPDTGTGTSTTPPPGGSRTATPGGTGKGHTEEPPDSSKAGGQAERKDRARKRRDKLRSYVTPRGGEQDTAQTQPGESNEHEYAVEDAARAIVCDYERKRGRNPDEMSRTHPGYDIESLDADGKVLRYIEVKGIDGEWTGFGAALRRQQFSTAWDEGDVYWLYVVEFARDPEHANVHAIQNPAMKVYEFFFDSNWRHVAEDSEDDLRGGFSVGARIDCGLLGQGTIEKTETRGQSTYITVNFDRGGSKYLPLNLKTMKLILDNEEDSDG